MNDVIGQYTGKIMYVKDGTPVPDNDRLIEIPAGIPGVVTERGHIAVPSLFGYLQGSKRSFATYAQDGGRNDTKVKVNAFLQIYMEHGVFKVQLVARRAIKTQAEIFLDYGEGYYSCTDSRAGVPGRRDLRCIPAWAAFARFKELVPDVVKEWTVVRRAEAGERQLQHGSGGGCGGGGAVDSSD